MSDKTQAMAEEMYQIMCDYVGADHPGKCIESIKFTLDSMEIEIERKTAECDKLRFRLMTGYDLVAESMADTKQYDFEARARAFVKAVQRELML